MQLLTGSAGATGFTHGFRHLQVPEDVVRPEFRVPVRGLLHCTVIARYSADGFFYPGKVDKMHNIRKASVAYERLPKQDVATRLVIPVTGAVSRPHLMVSN